MPAVEIPIALLDSLHHVKGFNESLFLQAHYELPPVSARINKDKVPDEDIFFKTSGIPVSKPVPWCTSAFYLSERPKFTLDPALHAGAYYVQEASSMFLHYLFNELAKDEKDLSVLDLCAAPGGKTTLLSSMPQVRLVVANEIIRARVSILYENLVKWGDPKIMISNSDPVQCRKIGGYFDVLLVDAPCSGSGLFRKDPGAINEWSAENVKHCAERQKRILSDALPALKEGGLLLYSTCSYSKEENEDIMDWLLQHASLMPLEVEVPMEWGITLTRSSSGAAGYRFFPGNAEGEGFFTCAFRLKDNSSGTFQDEANTVPLPKTEIPLLENWLSEDRELIYLKADNNVYTIPESIYPDYLKLSKMLNVRKAGIHAGATAHGKFIPEHELALSFLLNPLVAHINVDKEQALAYLKKQPFTTGSVEKGWFVIRYNGLSLGLIKHLGNRVNNYYPAAWRILMS
jgi:16S rRNA C967 or C1407 C5-methylase (RsmB/RsmF family)/NOL1/NOP2/fmu family ribosome biogenesis protein